MGLRLKLNYLKFSFLEVKYQKIHAKGDVLDVFGLGQ